MSNKLKAGVLIMGITIITPMIVSGENTPYESNKLRRKEKIGVGGRPLAPALRNDFIEYYLTNNTLQIYYPSNSLPATVVAKGADSGFTCLSTTAINDGPIELTLEEGEYVLTVTLVDERVYEGYFEVNAD
ncbi:MAG: hypothetical protein HDR98_05380 [Bacteroides sp.]|nr:hypothetical protein [Bacteroides sp.]